MSVSEKYSAPLFTDTFYHVYNRTNNKELLFLDDEDRQRFLFSYHRFLGPLVKTYSYCLLSNHFHFLLKVRPLEEILYYLRKSKAPCPTSYQRKILAKPAFGDSFHLILQSQFRRFFTSYSMYFNKKWKRKGNLFHRRFKRLAVQSDGHLTRLIYYIHSNPRKHGLMKNFPSYDWSSFQLFLMSEETYLEREAVFEWFGGVVPFLKYHLESEDLVLEDDFEEKEENDNGSS